MSNFFTNKKTDPLKKILGQYNKKTRAIISVSIISLILFLTAAAVLPFRDRILNTLYPKQKSKAESILYPISVPVLSLKFIPITSCPVTKTNKEATSSTQSAQGGQKSDCVDTRLTGDLQLTSTKVGSLDELRNRVKSYNQSLIQVLADGSKYHAYQDPDAGSSLQYSILDDKEFLQSLPLSATASSKPDYGKIMKDTNICDYVDNKGIKEVWLWTYKNNKISLDNSNMAMGKNSQSFWNKTGYGDISRSNESNDLPVCNNTYTLYNFVYESSYQPAIQALLQQMENIFSFVNKEMFEQMYAGGVDKFVGPRRCGLSNRPPNATQSGVYNVTSSVPSDCEDWQSVNCTSIDQSSACGGKRSDINCNKWGCEAGKYDLWWMQNIPGKDNALMVGNEKMKNWWDFIGNFDQALALGKSFSYPLPTPTTAVLTPTTTIIPSVTLLPSKSITPIATPTTAVIPTLNTGPTLTPITTTLTLAVPSAPTVISHVSCVSGSYSDSELTISWTNPGVAVSFVDIADNNSFTNYYHKAVTGTSTFAPIGFAGVGFSGNLIAQPGKTYYVRLYNGQHSPTVTFQSPLCPTPTPKPSLKTMPVRVDYSQCKVDNWGHVSNVVLSWNTNQYSVNKVYINQSGSRMNPIYSQSVATTTTSTLGPDSFSFTAPGNGTVPLAFYLKNTYLVWLSNGSENSQTVSFTIPSCP